MKEKLKEAARTLAALNAADACLGIETGNGQVQTVPITAIAYAAMDKGRVVLSLNDGRQVQVRPSDTLAGLLARLKRHAPFIRSHNAYLINLDQVDTIRRVRAGEYALTLFNGARVPLLQDLQAFMDYFGIASLDNVIPWNKRLAIILKENLRDFDKDIRLMPTEDIQRLFADGTGRLIITQLIGNIAWQAYSWIKSGRLDPFDGNLRSFWYSHIKPVLGRVLPAVNEGHYGAMSGVFARYVGTYGLFRYADFGFVEDNDSLRAIGDRHPQVIVLAEKKGHWRALQRIHAQTGATVISLGGQPSLMTTEYFVAALAQATPLDQTFHLITDVDYDPSGQIIAESFRAQLRQMGMKHSTIRHLIEPANFTAEELKYFKYPVKNDSPSDRAKVKQWLNPDRRRFPDRLPGGLLNEKGQREPMGLESDAMPRDRLLQLAAAAVEAVTRPPSRRRAKPPRIEGFPYL